MLVRNLLKAGDFVEPLPIGIPVTLQYKPTGNFEKVWLGFDRTLEESPDNCKSSPILYSEIVKKAKVPSHVSTKNGTLLVKGIIYTGKFYETVGNLPECIYDDLISDIKSGANFNFFGGLIESNSIKFSGSSQIRNWLQFQGFKILPGFIVPMGDVESHAKVSLRSTPFDYNLLSGFFIFRGSNIESKWLNRSIKQIEDITIYLDTSGYIRSELKLKDEDQPLYISYLELIEKKLYSGNVIVVESDNHIISKYPKDLNSIIKRDYECPVCGKKYQVKDEFARCTDTHCPSRLYPDVIHFMHKLKLPVVEYSEYLENVKTGKFQKFSDVLLFEEYSDLMIEVPLYNLIDAIIPVDQVRDRDSIWSLCSKCNNSFDSLIYYLYHPQAIQSDLDIRSNQLVTWLHDTQNVQDILDVVQYSNVVISGTAKKFEGCPIFRGKKIFLTGQFRHGNYSEIESILASYSAEVTGYEVADCCIIGDIAEGVDGGKVNKLRSQGIPVFGESDFFNMYDIDADIQ